MLNKTGKKSAAPTPRLKSKSKSNPKIKTKVIEINKPVTKPLSVKTKQIPIKTKSKDLNCTLLLKRQTPVRSKSRPKTSLSNTFKKPPKEIQYKINMNDLVTEEDMIIISEQTEIETLPTLNKNLQRKSIKRRFSEEEASALIQKTWRGYKTRKIVKHYINLYKKIDNDKAFSKLKSGSGTKKKQRQNDSRKLKIEDQADIGSHKNTTKSRFQININMNINISPVKQYNFKNIEQSQNRSKVSIKSVSIKSFNCKSFVSEDITQSQLVDPMLRIAQLQLNLIQSQQQKQLQRLRDKLDNQKIDETIYQIKKQTILKHYESEKNKLAKSRSQIIFGFSKVPLGSARPQSSKLKSKNHYSQDKLLINKLNNLNRIISLESQEDDLMSLDYNFSYIQNQKQFFAKEDKQYLPKTQNTQGIQKPRKAFISAFLEDDIEQINTQDIQNLSEGSLEMQIAREHVDYIQQVMQNKLLDELVIELYLNNSVSKQLSSFFDLTHISKFSKISNQDVSQFIDMMFSKFKPKDEDLLKRLNQKINPTAEELLKILRNQDGDGTDEFYQLVIPQKNFKDFREWREKDIQIKTANSNKINKVKVSIDDLGQEQKRKFEQKQKQYFDKKIRLGRFQKDLQAMYLKSVFNCLNEAIVETKCSYSPINGRSTIGPGQLRVSLLDSNNQISSLQIPKILTKSKNNVMRNFKFSCPSLNIGDYDSVYKFQQSLMKQLHEEITQSQHRWMSFFDQHLEIAMEIYNVVLEQLMVEAVRQIYWKVWKR